MDGQTYDYGLWGMVAFNVLIFGSFAVGLLRPRRSVEWRTLGVFSAFIVALFAEMYGFPLTICLLTGALGASPGGGTPFGHLNGLLLATVFGLPVWATLVICQIGALGMVGGLWMMEGMAPGSRGRGSDGDGRHVRASTSPPVQRVVPDNHRHARPVAHVPHITDVAHPDAGLLSPSAA